jgi:hypothetical protein
MSFLCSVDPLKNILVLICFDILTDEVKCLFVNAFLPSEFLLGSGMVFTLNSVFYRPDFFFSDRVLLCSPEAGLELPI